MTVADWGYGITITVLVLLLAGMIAMIRVISSDSEKYNEIKDVMNSLFQTPSFLRPGSGPDPGENRQAQGETASAAESGPFEDVCPACQEPVTHEHMECPSCGLRLLN